jgi:hypothetical protein
MMRIVSRLNTPLRLALPVAALLAVLVAGGRWASAEVANQTTPSPNAVVRACFPNSAGASVTFAITGKSAGVTTAAFATTGGQAGDSGQQVIRTAGADGCATAEIAAAGFGTVTVRATQGSNSVTTTAAVSGGTVATATQTTAAAPAATIVPPAATFTVPAGATVFPTVVLPQGTPTPSGPAPASAQALASASLTGQFTVLPSSTQATCAGSEEWIALYWRGASKAIFEALSVCPKADRVWVRRGSSWLGAAPAQAAGSDQFELEYGELVFMHGAP